MSKAPTKKGRPTGHQPTPPPGSTLLLRFRDVAYRLRLSVNRALELRKADPRFPRPVTPPGCLPLYVESELSAYVETLKAERDAKAGAAA